MHVLDGQGIDLEGFRGGPPTVYNPLKDAWRPDPSDSHGDRLSATLVNKHHPDVFRCIVCTWHGQDDWLEVPGIVLKPSAAVRDRINCYGWRDMGSLQFNCPRGNAGACHYGGCPPPQEWCEKRGSVAAQRGCSANVADAINGWSMRDCCVATGSLSTMLRMQDAHQPMGPCPEGRCEDFDGGDAWRYNEIILDKWHRPWEAHLAEIVEAVFVAPGVSAAALAYARAARAAILVRTGAPPSSLALVYYDHRAELAPFSPVPPA